MAQSKQTTTQATEETQGQSEMTLADLAARFDALEALLEAQGGRINTLERAKTQIPGEFHSAMESFAQKIIELEKQVTSGETLERLQAMIGKLIDDHPQVAQFRAFSDKFGNRPI